MNSVCIVQLNPSIQVVTPKGNGEAMGWMDYGKDDDLLWIVFLQRNGECWIYSNPQIRAVPNVTFAGMPGVSVEALSRSIGARHPRPSRYGEKKQQLRAPDFASPARPSRNGHGHKPISK